jgi:hypothetical protein
VAILVTDAPAKHAPKICPPWKSGKYPILQYSHTNCYYMQSVTHWHWHYTAQTNKRITKDTTNVLSVQPTQFYSYTVIPWLMKIIRSRITFVSRNTHTDGKDKLLEWPDRSCLLLYVSVSIH